MATRQTDISQPLSAIWTISKLIITHVKEIQTNRDLYLPLCDEIGKFMDAVIAVQHGNEQIRTQFNLEEAADLDQIYVNLTVLEIDAEKRSARDPAFGSSMASILNPWNALRRRGDDKVEIGWWKDSIERQRRVFETNLLSVQRRSGPSKPDGSSRPRQRPVISVATPSTVSSTSPREATVLNLSALEKEYLCAIDWDEETSRLLQVALNDSPDLPTIAHGTQDAQEWIDWLDKILEQPGLELRLYKQALRHLRRLCQKFEKLPTSCSLESDIPYDNKPKSLSTFSDVYQGNLKGRLVALKSLRMNEQDAKSVLKAFCKEASTWRSLRHSNIVKFLGVSKVFPVCLVSLWMPNGTVPEYLQKRPTTSRIAMIQQIVSGLTYMHSLDLVHGDIKPTNVLIDETGNARLTDFGLVSVLHNTQTFTKSVSGGGTFRWMAPELLSGDVDAENNGEPSFASDIYAVAIVIWEVFAGKTPYEELRTDIQVSIQVLKGRRPTRPSEARQLGLSDELWSITTQAWDEKVQERPSLAAIATVLETSA